MSVVCEAPDPTVGVAYRLSAYLDCQARALGENGFQAFAGGAIGTALLWGLITIFIALIGYRLILGHTPDVRDGVGWAVRLGIVIALITSWPAFQTLVYRVVVDGPNEIAAVLLPSAGLPAEGLGTAIQQAYDVLRLGTGDEQAAADAAAQAAGPAGQTGQAGQTRQTPEHALQPRPNVASVLVISTVGLAAALKIAIGLLLSLAPLAIVSLLFSGTVGLFNGWLRALAGSALALVGVTIVTALCLMAVESELAHLQAFQTSEASLSVDPQAMPTIVFLFALVAVIAALAGMRMGSALRLPHYRPVLGLPSATRSLAEPQLAARPAPVSRQLDARPAGTAAQARAAAVAEALSTTVHREQRGAMAPGGAQFQGAGRSRRAGGPGAELVEAQPPPRLGVVGRRGLGRRTRSAEHRDKMP